MMSYIMSQYKEGGESVKSRISRYKRNYQQQFIILI